MEAVEQAAGQQAVGTYIKPEFSGWKLSLAAKHLLSEIDQLCRKSGYCYASSAHLAARLEVSVRTVTNALAELKGRHFITKNEIGKWIVCPQDQWQRPAKCARKKAKIAEANIAESNANIAEDQANIAGVSANIAEPSEEEVNIGKKLNKNLPTAEASPAVKPRREPSAHQVMLSALATTCGMDVKLTAKMLVRPAKALNDAGYTPADLEQFVGWWKKYDWRGKTGQHPSPSQVITEISKSKLQGGERPVATPAHIQERNALISKRDETYTDAERIEFFEQNGHWFEGVVVEGYQPKGVTNASRS